MQHKHDEIPKDLQRCALNLAYEAEVSIDSILVKYNALWHSFCSLPAIIEEINHINVEVTKMGSVNLALRPFFVVEPSKHLPPQHSNVMNDDDDIVGFEDDTKIIIRHLIRGTSELDVIPIVGMGGKGKTTCAKKLYNNDIIVSHFDVRAWGIISQTYNRIELLQDIFSQVTGSKGEKDDVLAEMLKKKLTVKRYLIVLDDMWDGKAWDDLRLCFPDVGNRSRIVLTTRLEKVAKQAKHHTDPYYLPFLKPDESLKLLQKKVFQQEGCQPELQDVSQAVAERCKGLPLVIILVAGIIKRKKMEVSWWDELSYNNLPDHLKPCLLYMGMFLEDARIPVSKLISLWIAEDFVQNIESIEEAAEGYLMELISSNMVMVSKRGYKVKYCQVHDVVLHFCLEKSRNEKFMLAVKGHGSQFQPCDWKESRVRFTFSEELSKESRKPFHQHLRSLITTNQAESYHWNPIRQGISITKSKVLPASFWKMGKLRHVDVSRAEFDKQGISRWDASEESFPQLETLVIKRCDDLEEIPLSFADISTLKQIKLNKCQNESLKASSAKMKEDVEENEGNDRIDLIIKDW
ncbi:hypothetical protein KY289_029824 [Solanum tuberosum]|nr:hypothetical protein KY289_029824 [Solanum tuberosum]